MGRRIVVNGELVDESDPRARQRAAAARAPPAPPVGSHAAAGPHTAPAPRAGAGGGGGPLELLETHLGLAGKHLTTPPVPQLGWLAVRVPLVWLAAYGIVFVLVSMSRPGTELQLLAGGALALGLYVHTVSTGAPPGGGPPPPPGAPGRGGGGGGSASGYAGGGGGAHPRR